MAARSKETGRFRARAQDGREFIIIERTEVLVTGPTTPPVDGQKSYELADGTGVNPLPDGTCEFLELGRRVRLVRFVGR